MKNQIKKKTVKKKAKKEEKVGSPNVLMPQPTGCYWDYSAKKWTNHSLIVLLAREPTLLKCRRCGTVFMLIMLGRNFPILHEIYPRGR